MLKDKWKKDKLSFSVITNKNLICSDCAFMLDDTKNARNTTRCNKYKLKPSKVLLGKGCVLYKKETK